MVFLFTSLTCLLLDLFFGYLIVFGAVGNDFFFFLGFYWLLNGSAGTFIWSSSFFFLIKFLKDLISLLRQREREHMSGGMGTGRGRGRLLGEQGVQYGS